MSQNTKALAHHNKTFIGKYILDSVSFGMYDRPLMAIREYVQNSADAIDALGHSNGDCSAGKGMISITVDGRNKSIQIRDDGTGVSSRDAWNILHDLGRSQKDNARDRGFRGIGRLGGLGYCEELKFTTKAEGENIVSISVWDCTRLRQLVNEKSSFSDAASIVERITTFKQERHTGDDQDHFFTVEMNNVRSSRGVLLNVPAIKAYLSQVAPLPFHPTNFRFSHDIDRELRNNVSLYETYCVRVNGETIYKPYADRLRICKQGYDEIKGIQFFELSNGSIVLAFGWMSEVGLLGTIAPSTLMDGLRVRRGNMQIGDKDILSECYRERRFGNYLLGEIHVVDNGIVPNSRRDDFEDNNLRDELHTCFIRGIGIPYSKKIRELSADRSRRKKAQGLNAVRKRAQKVIKYGYVSDLQKQDLIQALQGSNREEQDAWPSEDMAALIHKLQQSKHVLSRQNGLSAMDYTTFAKRVLDIIYRVTENKMQAETLIEKLLSELSEPAKK